MKVAKAVFPDAEFGTRFLSATKALPTDLLPSVDKPLVPHAEEEAIIGDIDNLIIVTGKNKRASGDHFDVNNELENILRATGKHVQANMIHNIIPESIHCIFVSQAEECQKRLGD